MASPLPTKLKAAGLQPFASRAGQLEKYRPIAWYWISYHTLQTILSRQLHLGDEASQTYALKLMDTLETYKTNNSHNDAIVDDVAAKAYMENFALETFNKADAQQRDGKVGKGTVDTFTAAATFIDVLGIWGAVDEELGKKGRFAKFHAVRIAKAIKAGEDPNETNPIVEEEVEAVQGQVADEREVERELDEMVGYRAPAVQDEVDGVGAHHQMDTSHVQHPPHHSGNNPDISPIEPDHDNHVARQASIGGGYFPSVPNGTSNTTQNEISMPDFSTAPDPPEQHIPHQQDSMSSAAEDFYSSHSDAVPKTLSPSDQLNASTSTTTDLGGQGGTTPTPPFTSSVPTPAATTPFSAAPPAVQTPQTSIPTTTPGNFHPSQQHIRTPVAPPPPAVPRPAGGYNTDDEAVLVAQKHAKWAISALNFEDVETAVKELRIALGALGAS
ncbi:hypothetical protein LTR78_008895 [Recurvomyces mirabilis]|uniref:DUF605-domain-containing protein n=1 Tax=Recurvomyces mirabilis TaxID=574656 RepID=A0AAE0WGS8_9PEZI|nr:hypothetical protein LTR78_008895 [Recurvomyces mirabilis]KAK5155810.1 hypothetical protein LTS14_005376 [Recurvomyces mirabilis]